MIRPGNKGSGLVFPALLILLFATTLVNSRRMPSPSQAAYFLYIFSVSVIAISSGLAFIFSSRRMAIYPSPALAIMISWGLYVIARGSWAGNTLPMHAVYIVATCLLSFCIISMRQLIYPSLRVVIRGIVLLACAESVIAILQLAGVIPGMNNNFRVTGTWVNPNVTAMFLAMSAPAVMYLLLDGKKWDKGFAVTALILIVCGLCLLQCRTAVVGALVAVGMILGYRWRWLQWMANRRQIGLKLALSTVIMAGLWIGGLAAYHAKQASADGRRLIWKLSMQMMAERPLAGVGYGRFEYEYNLHQAKYFSGNAGMEEEKKNAAYVHMAYNEFLEHGVEGGIPGLLLFAGVILSFIRQGLINWKKADGSPGALPGIVWTAAVVSFALMSCMNFTLQAIPAMGLFVFYGSILSFRHQGIPMGRWSKFFIGALLLAAAGWMLYTQGREVEVQWQLKKAQREIKGARFLQAAAILTENKDLLKGKAGYWECMGKLAYMREDYRDAANFFSMGRRWSSEPAMFILSGNAFEMQEQYDSAEQQYITALNMEPSRMLPRYTLMNMYLRMGDTARAVGKAVEIMALQPKVASTESERFKTAAVAVSKLARQ